jgi:hypothetical protein
MTGALIRRVLEVDPAGPWLAIATSGWVVDTSRRGHLPLAYAWVWLQPLLERSRAEVEADAGRLLRPGDPALSEPIRAVLGGALREGRAHWAGLALAWLWPEEVCLFSAELHEIALSRHGPQAMRHQAKHVLRQCGLWAP